LTVSRSEDATIHVFVGPTLGTSRVAELLPQAKIHPPIAHGMVLELPLRRGDVVAVIDGVFYQSISVRHKELLHLLNSGVAVFGAASMGALRAAELRLHGMQGVGVIYRLFTTGVLEGDDEVAVLHATEADDFEPLNEALVNMRLTARRARRAHVLTSLEEALLIEVARSRWFGDRHYERVVALAMKAGLPQRAGTQFLEFCALSRVNAKQSDAELLLKILRDGRMMSPQIAPPSVGITAFTYEWLLEAEGAVVDGVRVLDTDALTLCQLFAPDYSTFHQSVLLRELARLAGHEHTGSSSGVQGRPEMVRVQGPAERRVLEREACQVAERLGITSHCTCHVPKVLHAWLREAELQEPYESAVALAMVRAFRWAPGLPVKEPLLKALRYSAGFTTIQEVMAQIRLFNAHLESATGLTVDRIATRAVRELFTREWGGVGMIDRLDHGFISEADFDFRARQFVAYAYLHGCPKLPRLLHS